VAAPRPMSQPMVFKARADVIPRIRNSTATTTTLPNTHYTVLAPEASISRILLRFFYDIIGMYLRLLLNIFTILMTLGEELLTILSPHKPKSQLCHITHISSKHENIHISMNTQWILTPSRRPETPLGALS
jgi:hypothetical protein